MSEMTDTTDSEHPPLDSSSPLLAVEDLHMGILTERGTVRAVDGVSLTLRRGKTIGVVGESGSGKTMLAKSIMGLLPRGKVDRTGSVRLDGVELLNRSRKQMRKVWGTELSMVPQDPMQQSTAARRRFAAIQVGHRAESAGPMRPLGDS